MDSLELGYAIPPGKIDACLEDCRADPSISLGDVTSQLNLGVSTWPFEWTTWFHFTRSWRDTDYADGLLGMQGALPRLWERLRLMTQARISEHDWLQFRDRFENEDSWINGQMYRDKLSFTTEEGGPHAFLIRSEGIQAAEGTGDTRDYTRPPEIIEDILEALEEHFETSFLSSFLRETHPRCVTFKHPLPTDDAINIALRYILNEKSGAELEPGPTFTSQGKPIPAADIISIEELGQPWT